MTGLALGLVLGLALGCQTPEPPPTVEVLALHGTPYEQGVQHGAHFASKIRSLYTRLIESSILPYLNREQHDVMTFLPEYRDPIYADGAFSYQLLLQSGQALAQELAEQNPAYLDEMHGIADGAGVPFEHVLILNTFIDTMLAFRSITMFIKGLQAPQLTEMCFLSPGQDQGLAPDGKDNDGDGQTDEDGEGQVLLPQPGGKPPAYGPSDHAVLVEVPTDARIRLVLHDPPPLTSLGTSGEEEHDWKEGEDQGMDPDSVRIQWGDRVFRSGDPALDIQPTGEEGRDLVVIFTPPGGLPAASVQSLIVSAGNRSRIVDPPPVHARFLRDEHVSFGTVGLGKAPHEIPNVGAWDGRSQPPALAFAVRGSATPDGAPRLAWHFALLDANVVHEHSAVLIHPADPSRGLRAHVTLGWVGLVGGLAGMNDAGLALGVTTSDTLDNPLSGAVKRDLLQARLCASGTPLLVQIRELLGRSQTVDETQTLLSQQHATFGWIFLTADAQGGLRAVEVDGESLDPPPPPPEGQAPTWPVHAYGPEAQEASERDAWGRPLASVGPDDLRIASHFVANVPDIDTRLLLFQVPPQATWSTFYYRSVRAFFTLGETLRARYGSLDTAGCQEVLRTPALVDPRDSMGAGIFEPRTRDLYYAMGTEPATDGPFRLLRGQDWLSWAQAPEGKEATP